MHDMRKEIAGLVEHQPDVARFPDPISLCESPCLTRPCMVVVGVGLLFTLFLLIFEALSLSSLPSPC